MIGVILSGGLDDGAAGLWAIKEFGGIAVVQDPEDAEFPSMPESALRAVDADHCVPVAEMGKLLTKLSVELVESGNGVDKDMNTRMQMEIGVAMEENTFKKSGGLGDLTPYTCPECHGVLSSLKEGGRIRFRCHTGHAFSADSLLETLTETIEESLWSAIRSIQESVIFLNHMGDHFAEANQPKVAALYFKKAKEAESRIKWLRQAVFSHEQLNADNIRREAGQQEGADRMR